MKVFEHPLKQNIFSHSGPNDLNFFGNIDELVNQFIKIFEKIATGRKHKKNSKGFFYNLLIGACNKNLKDVLRFILIIYVLKISSKSVDAETRDRHRKM